MNVGMGVTGTTNAVKVLEGDDDFGREETDHIFSEDFPGLPLQEQEELAPGAEIRDQANVRLRLEGGVESGQKRMVQQRQNVPLCSRSVHLVPLHHHALVHCFHGELQPRLSKLHQVHASHPQHIIRTLSERYQPFSRSFYQDCPHVDTVAYFDLGS